MKKSPYLLLELLIAIALILLCASLFVQTPLKSIQKEIILLEEMELERHADNLFIETKRMLYRNMIPWENLSGKEICEMSFEKFQLKGISHKTWNSVVTIDGSEQKTGINGEDCRLLRITVLFQSPKEKRSFSYRVLAKKEGLLLQEGPKKGTHPS